MARLGGVVWRVNLLLVLLVLVIALLVYMQRHHGGP